MLKQKLQEDLKRAMLGREELKTSVLRLLLSAINYYEIQKELGYQANDEDVISVIQNEVKKRRESIEMFKKGERQDLVDKETTELEILQTYLPEQLSNEEIKKLVIEIIKETGAKSIQDMGKVMGTLMSKVKGRADGTLVSQIVKELLAS